MGAGQLLQNVVFTAILVSSVRLAREGVAPTASSAQARNATTSFAFIDPLPSRSCDWPPVRLPPLPFVPALRFQQGASHPAAIRVADESGQAALCLGAEVGGADQDAAPTRGHGQDELAHRCIGNRREGAADATLVGVDSPGDVDLDPLPAQGEDEVGQRVVGGAQVGGAFHWLGQQRREGSDMAVDRARGAVAGGELPLGADRPDMRPGQERAGWARSPGEAAMLASPGRGRTSTRSDG